MDFYLAQFKAFEAIFNGEFQDCFFYFRQPIKNLKSKKELFGKYLINGKGKCRFVITQFDRQQWQNQL
ncbi:hypothetical protein DSO57_1022772 [Entomophthora muscae]|uniref:Uncharacterized protein n=1 Tax=Entomophthora muscae TaxID=34485 RepID=A0ACC2T2Y3_9FUNG|nr:hypothetical protein DSO57_1022772 [Entomophthora muscae]